MKCFECGNSATENHHVVPKSKGGNKTIPLCGVCHSKIHSLGKRRDDIRTLTKDALAHKKSKGERTGGIPFGYELDEDGIHLIENQREQSIISIVLSLKELGYSYRNIAKELENRGLKNKAHRIKWSATQIFRILQKQGK